MTRRRQIIFGVVAALVLLPVLAAGIFLLTFDPNEYAPDVVAAVEDATGRTLVLGSPIRIDFSLNPVIEADDVSLANPPGFPDATFMTLQKLQARIALLPLLSHRLDIQRLVLVGPVVTLEKTSTGQVDWDFERALPPDAPGGPAPAAPPGGGSDYKVALEAVEVQSGQVIFKDAKGVQAGALQIADLTGSADSPSAPLNLTAQASYNGAPFTLNGRVGPVERFSGVGSGPWPVDLSFAANGATATLNGSVANPGAGTGYDFAVTAAVPALEAFQPWVGGAFTLPPVHGLTAAARLRDQGSAMPAITGLVVKAGASDFSALRAGLTLNSLDIEMASLAKPLNVNIAGSAGGAPVTVSGTLGALAALLNPAWLPPAPGPVNPEAQAAAYPVNLQAQGAGATVSVTGGVATPWQGSGVALAVKAAIPDLSRLGALLGVSLPDWKTIAVQTTVTDPGGLGLANSVGVDGLTWSMDDAAFGGEASLYFGAQPKLEASLTGQTINLDAVLGALPSPAAAPAPAGTAPVPPPAAATGDFTQSMAQLPVKLLQTASADVQVSVDTLVMNRATYRALQTHVVLANGVLTVDPLTAILPGGGISANGSIDVTKSPAAETVSISAPALELGPFLRGIGVPDDAEGTMQAALNASGSGNTPRDFFASVNGQLGLASVNGTVSEAVLDSLFGAVLRTVGLPEAVVGAQGPVALRCFALRVDAADGVGTIRALTLDSSRLLVQGGGTIGFGDESLNVIVRPELRVVGADFGVPVQIGGTFDDPATSVAPLSALQAAGQSALGLPVTVVQQAAQHVSILGQVASGLGLNGTAVGNALTGTQPDVCPAALALGRLGGGGPAPEPVSATAPGSGTPHGGGSQGGPQNLLNSLFGK